jgi:very-short-patch-repair endonuclease
MFYGASPDIIEKAAQLRKNMTNAENILWEFLRKHKVIGLRFRRQHPISLFIADFYCHAIKLVIEVDGGYHKNREQKAYDIGRTAELNEFGIDVIRFTNQEIENEFSRVKQEIIKACVERRDLLKQLPEL